MTRGVVIALAIGVVLVGGLGFVVYRKQNSKSVPPPYAGTGPSPQNPNGPPSPGKQLGSTFQDIKSAVQGGDELIMAGKKAWDDVSGLFD